MASQAAIDSLSRIPDQNAWVAQLASILPLSALIEFIEISPKLHILELAGAIPLWSWVITPSGSRLLLAKREKLVRDCCQDRSGIATSLEALDGRYGDRYLAPSSKTLRLVLNAYPVVEIQNDHDNMAGQGFELRAQNLDVVHLARRDPNVKSTEPRLLWCHTSPFYLASVVFGWILLIAIILMSAIFQTWISFTFLAFVPFTGMAVFCLYGNRPRRLLVENKSEYTRLLVVTEHMNSANWLVIYGESTIVNSLINRPLEPNGPSLSPTMTHILRFLLCVLIIGQWVLACGAAATANWNSFFICIWMFFSILSDAYLITPNRGANNWSKYQANLKVERYGTQLSSRRALINTIIALNPDTFCMNEHTGAVNMTKVSDDGMRWVDAILRKSNGRKMWEEATLKAMVLAQPQLAAGDLSSPRFRKHLDNFLGPAWNTDYADPKACFWRRFVPEGIYIAAKIRKVAKLPERKIDDAATLARSQAEP
ncbi:hypothetical protein OIDMADRAFT_134497 [Oidiodendron maius Zn]|uniref:Uncharacterized protein n=1 Tax=Oidiodendron maius (strain Zn) TaxID=913774 RepID=A0A0C3GVY4_OIDMZ|nr:hypothetical protein OIDMADRAFT_134497 [Oidiodendron maius Zn]